MKAKWIEEFRNLSQQQQMIFASKAAAFSISILTILSLYDLYSFFSENPKYLNEFIETMELIPSVLIQLILFAAFSTRFILLFFRDKKVFWINQAIWFAGVSVLIGYYFYSLPNSNSHFAIYSMYPEQLLKNSSHIFGFLGLGYLCFSIFTKFTTLAIAIIKPK